MIKRPRRLRANDAVRGMIRETRMSASSLIYPLFIEEGNGIEKEISSMQGQFRYSLDRLPYALEDVVKSGVSSVLLFGIPHEKDEIGSGGYSENGIVQQAVRAIKKDFPNLHVVTDVCMCEYTSHGHCGILDGHNVDNDKTLEYLSKIALSHAQAGADMVAPSDMMDGRVNSIRQTLDQAGFEQTPIMSYSIKYASSFYGPFREAADSAPSFGDRKTYQMDYHNVKEGLKLAEIDTEYGADILMVKPALSYLDVISKLSDNTNLPVAAYSVSGEYSMIKAASKAGYIDEEKMIMETATSIYRAGADILITYFAKDLAKFINEGRMG